MALSGTFSLALDPRLTRGTNDDEKGMITPQATHGAASGSARPASARVSLGDVTGCLGCIQFGNQKRVWERCTSALPKKPLQELTFCWILQCGGSPPEGLQKIDETVAVYALPRFNRRRLGGERPRVSSVKGGMVWLGLG